jgi:hypothetical protein
MNKTFDQLTDDQKVIARRIARADAARIAHNVRMVTDPDTGEQYIDSDIKNLDATRLAAIHNAVPVVDMAYILTSVFADDVLRQQFQELVQSLLRNRTYEIADDTSQSEIVELPTE